MSSGPVCPQQYINIHSDLTLKKSHAYKKWDTNGHLTSIMFPYNNIIGISVKKRDMNAIHPRFLKGEI